ncbi:ATP-binding protein [Phyllobacterium brassicacearum]|uniref:ATP-binding protein n=1 Tax=Phyllobacterium brassicacearum TaxID=314235 RepID=UPI0010E76730|nr:ATP-binding protein [Phyllobacterium brassicacearum]TDQ18195.1 signal transduction histidine kinase [Phyllobacterium brassicacearum]
MSPYDQHPDVLSPSDLIAPNHSSGAFLVLPTAKTMVSILSKHVRAYGLYLLYLAFPVLIAVACWSFLKTDVYRREAYRIISEVNEVQWRAAQIREKTVSAMGWTRLAQETGKSDYLQPLKRDTIFLAANIQALVSQDYAAHILPQDDIDHLNRMLALVNYTIKPQLSEGADYGKILSEFDTIWTYVVPITSSAASLGRTFKRTADLDQQAFRNSFLLASASAMAIAIMIFLILRNRSQARFDSHVRHFALLFSHMTYTRINSLHAYVHDTLNHTSVPDFTRLNKARQRTTDLSIVNDWLARIAYPKYDPDGTPIVSLDTVLMDVCKPDGSIISPTVISGGVARQSLVPQAQFFLMLQELVRNAKDAVADRDLPEICVRANVKTGLFFDKYLVVSVEDNGVGMSPDHLKKATTPFFSSKGESRRNSGLGLTGCARLVETMHGRLFIESKLDKGTTVTISFPIRSLKNFIR